MENVLQSRPFKTATEVRLSKKPNIIDHPDLLFYSNIAPSSQKHPGLILHDKLNFNEQFNKKLYKATKGTGILRKCITSYKINIADNI